MFSSGDYLPWEIMETTLKDFQSMGGKAIEVTGGGEPLMYPFVEELFTLCQDLGLEYAMVSNGTMLTEELAQVIMPKALWVRYSWDAATPNTYAKVRNVSRSEFGKAIKAVELTNKYKQHKEMRVGVGFVVGNENYHEIFESCKLAKESGADNVRIGIFFAPDSLSYFTEKALKIGQEQSQKVVDLLSDENFAVYNLFDERVLNNVHGTQDYDFCMMKEIRNVVGADAKLYTCCTLAYNEKGCIGDLRKHRFKEIYDSEEKHNMFTLFNPIKKCRFPCLYEHRNKVFLEIQKHRDRYKVDLNEKPFHVNYV